MTALMLAAVVFALSRDNTKVCEITLPAVDADSVIESTNLVDGVAWRIRYTGEGERTIPNEEWVFDFGADLRCWPVSHAQGEYVPKTLSTIGNAKPMPDVSRKENDGHGRNYSIILPGTAESPLVVEGPSWTAILGDAGAPDHARTRFASGPRPGTVKTVLEGAAKVTLPYVTPWRYIHAASSPSELAQTQGDFLKALNAPSRIADTGWIKPGKVLRVSKLTREIAFECVDFAVRNAFGYIELDSGWYGDERTHDPLKPRADLDLPGIIAYAKTKGIGVILYVNREPLKKNATEIFDRLAAWGVAGVKLGFVNVGRQDWRKLTVEWIEQCAARRLMVDIHDEFRLAGLEKTYPNVLTVEGICGNEEMPCARHNAALVYTRFLDGPGDYTPCWKVGRIQTTLAHQLAMPCVYSSGWQFLFWYQQPSQIDEKDPALAFWREIPCVFDEARFLSGAIGESAVVARRVGRRWFIGCLNANGKRTFTVPLNFAGAGRKTIRLFRDADPDNAKPLAPVACECIKSDADGVLTVTAAANGGWAAIIDEDFVPSEWGAWREWGDLGDGTYQNPILPADFSDIDCITHEGRHYAITSTMQLSPGMAILESDDMVSWRIIGHVVADAADLGPDFAWNRMRRYGRGVWAGAIRVKDGRFYVYFGCPDEGLFVCTADKPEGPWSKPRTMSIGGGWDDCCPLFDNDGKNWFVATHFSDNYKTYVFRMTNDVMDIVPGSGVLINEGAGREANKLYVFGGKYYHLFSEVAQGGRRLMMQRGDKPTGPYTERRILSHPQWEWHEPNQGGYLQDAAGNWFFLTHHGHGDWCGRVASLLPVTWVDGWPIIGEPGPDGIGRMVWRHTNPVPFSVKSSPPNAHGFTSPEWEWNHSPLMEKVRLAENRLELDAFPPLQTGDFFTVGNILSRRSWRTVDNTFTIVLLTEKMTEGQCAGLCHFGGGASEFGVKMVDGKRFLYIRVADKERRLDEIGESVYLRTTWGLDGHAKYAWSSDGKAYIQDPESVTLSWGNYRGSRVGVYTYNENGESGTAVFTLPSESDR
ncbi:MAG: glycoside hydrolase family 97 catalytic domain-containing protein [Kiritimatiellae bacterium]|nr:glycoside hydrolase family 97 catalytic domain-containing protein [Kiritimatiellia bacterium]